MHELRGPDAAGTGDGDDGDPCGEGCEDADHFVDGLVGECGEDEVGGASAGELAKARGKRRCARRVVGAVEHGERVAAENLEAPGQLTVARAACAAVSGMGTPWARRASMAASASAALASWCSPSRRRRQVAAPRRNAWPSRVAPSGSMAAGSAKESGAPASAAARRRTSSTSGRWRKAMAGTPALKMPAFSAAMASSVSPRYSVWSRSMRVTAEAGRDEVCGVEAAAEAGFEHGPADAGAAECEEGEGGGSFEEGGCLEAGVGGHGVDVGTHFVVEIEHGGFGHGCSD